MKQPSRRCPSCGDRLTAAQDTCLRCRRELARMQALVPAAPPPDAARGSRRPWLVIAVGVIGIAALAGVATRTGPPVPAGPAAEGARPAPVVDSRFTSEFEPQSSLPESATGVSSAGALAAGFSDFQAGNFGSARDRFQEAIEREPGNADALNGAGQCLLQMSRPAEAVPFLERAVEARPGDATFRFNLAVALERIGSLPRAVSEYQRLAKAAPSDPRLFCNLGLALRRLGRDEEAMTAFEKATELAPGESVAWMGLALTLDRQRRFEAAASAFERFLSLAPDSPDAPRIREHASRLHQAGSGDSRIPGPEFQF